MEWPVTQQSMLGPGGLSSGVGWERFYAQYEGVICNFARFQGLDEHSARDVLQETIMVLIRELPAFNYNPERAKFRTWLKIIVRHKIEEARRRRRDGKNISGDLSQDGGPTLFERMVAENQQDYADADEKNWRQAIYQEAWKRISSDPRVQRESLKIFIALMQKTPIEVISQETGLEPNAIYQIKNRMTKRLEKERLAIEASLAGQAEAAT